MNFVTTTQSLAQMLELIVVFPIHHASKQLCVLDPANRAVAVNTPTTLLHTSDNLWIYLRHCINQASLYCLPHLFQRYPVTSAHLRSVFNPAPFACRHRISPPPSSIHPSPHRPRACHHSLPHTAGEPHHPSHCVSITQKCTCDAQPYFVKKYERFMIMRV